MRNADVMRGDGNMMRAGRREAFDNAQKSAARIALIAIQSSPFTLHHTDPETHVDHAVRIGNAATPPPWQCVSKLWINASGIVDQIKRAIDSFGSHRIEMNCRVNALCLYKNSFQKL